MTRLLEAREISSSLSSSHPDSDDDDDEHASSSSSPHLSSSVSNNRLAIALDAGSGPLRSIHARPFAAASTPPPLLLIPHRRYLRFPSLSRSLCIFIARNFFLLSSSSSSSLFFSLSCLSTSAISALISSIDLTSVLPPLLLS